MIDTLVSVIMSIYKEPIEWLKQSIDSILNQTHKKIEFLIVIDNPAYIVGINLLEEYAEKDARILLIKNEVNIGLTKSLNKALALAKGEYIARMDADDISMPERFERQLQCFKETEIGVCFGYFDKINGNGDIIFQYRKKVYPEELFLYNIYAHPTAMFKSSFLSLRKPLYNEGFKCAQDYELWTLFFQRGINFKVCEESLLMYRISNTQITSHRKDEQIRSTQNIRKNLIKIYLSRFNIEFSINELALILSSIENLINNENLGCIEAKNLMMIRYLCLLKLSKQNFRYCLKYLMMPKYYVRIHNSKRIILLESLHLRAYPLYDL